MKPEQGKKLFPPLSSSRGAARRNVAIQTKSGQVEEERFQMLRWRPWRHAISAPDFPSIHWYEIKRLSTPGMFLCWLCSSAVLPYRQSTLYRFNNFLVRSLHDMKLKHNVEFKKEESSENFQLTRYIGVHILASLLEAYFSSLEQSC